MKKLTYVKVELECQEELENLLLEFEEAVKNVKDIAYRLNRVGVVVKVELPERF